MSLMSPTSPTSLDSLNIIVGNKEFEVRPSIFQKFPNGMLARIFAPSKAKLLKSTKLNLERDAELFSLILDFYETGSFNPDPSLARDRLEDEAKYYGIYENMFPFSLSPTKKKPLSKRESLRVNMLKKGVELAAQKEFEIEELEAMEVEVELEVEEESARPNPRITPPPSPPSSPEPEPEPEVPPPTHTPIMKPPHRPNHNGSHYFPSPHVQQPTIDNGNTYLFARSLPTDLTPSSKPFTVTLRPNESLSIENISGVGKLLMSVGDVAKSVIVVQKATIYDSDGLFHTANEQSMEGSKPYPGGYLYEFMVEGASGSCLRINFRQHFEFDNRELVPNTSPIKSLVVGGVGGVGNGNGNGGNQRAFPTLQSAAPVQPIYVIQAAPQQQQYSQQNPYAPKQQQSPTYYNPNPFPSI